MPFPKLEPDIDRQFNRCNLPDPRTDSSTLWPYCWKMQEVVGLNMSKPCPSRRPQSRKPWKESRESDTKQFPRDRVPDDAHSCTLCRIEPPPKWSLSVVQQRSAS